MDNSDDDPPIDDVLARDGLLDDPDEPAAPSAPPAATRRDLGRLMRRISVTLTLEVGEARVSLDELLAIRTDSVVPLETRAGEPLVIKVNGTPIGRAEVVATGDHYGLRVVELAPFDLDALEP